MIQTLLEYLHALTIGGHFGIQATFVRARSHLLEMNAQRHSVFLSLIMTSAKETKVIPPMRRNTSTSS